MQQQQPNSLMQSDIPAATANTDNNQEQVTQFQDTRPQSQIQQDAITSSLGQEGGFSSQLHSYPAISSSNR